MTLDTESNPIPDKTKTFQDKVSILINLFIKPEIREKESFGRAEFVAASRLIKKYKDFDFFYELPELTNKLNSLFGLLSRKVIDLDSKYAQYISEKQKNPHFPLEKNPIIDIIVEKKKPKCLLDFLNEKN